MMGKSILRGVYQKMAAPTPQIYEKGGIVRLQDLIAAHNPNPPAVTIDPPEDVISLHYTGGTTGPPKGVMISQYNVVYTIEILKRSITFDDFVGMRVVSYLPMAHIAERIVSQYSLIAAGLDGDHRIVHPDAGWVRARPDHDGGGAEGVVEELLPPVEGHHHRLSGQDGKPGGFVRQPLAALGRWSLSFYMLHQPVLIGLLMLWMQWQRQA